MMQSLYLAHPFAGDPDNLGKALQWFRAIQDETGHVVMADWLNEVRIYNDADPKERAGGIRRNLFRLDHCDEFWVAGDDLAVQRSKGVRAEFEHMVSRGRAKACRRVVRNASPAPFSQDFGGLIIAPFFPKEGYWIES